MPQFNSFDKAIILLTNLDHIKVNHDHPDWVLIGRNPAQPDQYRYGTSKERRTAKLPHVPAPTKYGGIHHIEINTCTQTVKITVTSKLLPDPSKMLGADNFRLVWEAINNTGLLWIDADAAQAAAGLLAADITRDFRMVFQATQYVRLLTRYYIGKDYRRVPYGPNTLWQSAAGCKRNKRSLTLYDKSSEAQGTEFYAPNTLRLELRLTSLEMLRKYLGLTDCKGHLPLQAALESCTDSVAVAFQEIMAGIQLDILTAANVPNQLSTAGADRETLFLSELDLKAEGIFLSLQRAAFNLEALRARTNAKNGSRDLAPYKKMLTSWLAFDSDASQDITLFRELISKFQAVPSGAQALAITQSTCPNLNPIHPEKAVTCGV